MSRLWYSDWLRAVTPTLGRLHAARPLLLACPAVGGARGLLTLAGLVGPEPSGTNDHCGTRHYRSCEGVERNTENPYTIVGDQVDQDHQQQVAAAPQVQPRHDDAERQALQQEDGERQPALRERRDEERGQVPGGPDRPED